MGVSTEARSVDDEKIITSTCSSHCGGKCVFRLHIRNGIISKIEADDSGEPQLRPCLRGRAYRQRVYSPGRLRYPMRRVGVRGEGRFERISWDEAFDKVAAELKRVNDTYGPAANLILTGGGDHSSLHCGSLFTRLLWMWGGATKTWGQQSNEGGAFAALSTFGTAKARSTFDDLLNARLIILWGWNPACTVGGHASWYLAQAKEKGIKIIAVDPRYTDTAATFAEQWVPIVPGTDAALLSAMAYVILERNLQDQQFLDRYTIGFDRFQAYVQGKEDGIPKDTAWAEAITGVSAAVIERLAVEFATSKPAALLGGIAPGRTAFGEQYHRAVIALSAMTGNIGIPGGSSGGMIWAVMVGGYPFLTLSRIGRGMGVGDVPNPVEHGAPKRPYALPSYGANGSSARIHFTQIADAILRGKAGGYPADFKLLYIADTGYPNQYANINKAVRALQKLEFVVVSDQFMTPSAKYADILLPTCTIFEKNDVTSAPVTPPFYGYMHKVIEPLFESKSHLEIAVGLANRLGVADFSPMGEEEWLQTLIQNTQITDYAAFKKRGFYKIELSRPYVAFQDQIEKPDAHPFPSPSGKIEIYSRQLAEMGHPGLPPIPKYIETWESRNDPLTQKYPLQLITTHMLRRAHTQFDNLPWLQEIQEQTVSIHPTDARPRGIKDGDWVRAFNDRGEMRIRAKITERILPGVMDIPQGAWYDPDEKGIDRAGSVNVLTRDEHSPGGAVPHNTCLVQIAKGDD
ncbi:MAG: molybdopterin-dependent oxidoreductase [Pseudomonadota bacterium]